MKQEILEKAETKILKPCHSETLNIISKVMIMMQMNNSPLIIPTKDPLTVSIAI